MVRAFPPSVAPLKGIEDGRVTFTGDVAKVAEEEIEGLKALYKAKHPSAVWVDFLGDLSWCAI